MLQDEDDDEEEGDDDEDDEEDGEGDEDDEDDDETEEEEVIVVEPWYKRAATYVSSSTLVRLAASLDSSFDMNPYPSEDILVLPWALFSLVSMCYFIILSLCAVRSYLSFFFYVLFVGRPVVCPVSLLAIWSDLSRFQSDSFARFLLSRPASRTTLPFPASARPAPPAGRQGASRARVVDDRRLQGVGAVAISHLFRRLDGHLYCHTGAARVHCAREERAADAAAHDHE